MTQRRAKREISRKEREKKQRKERKTKPKITCAQGAGRVPRGRGCSLLVRSVPCYVQVIDRHKDTIRPDNKLDGQRKERERAETPELKSKKTPFLCPAGVPRTTKETQRRAKTEGQKTLTMKQNKRSQKQNKLEHRVAQPTQNCRVRGVPSTWQGRGQHSKQRTEIVTQQAVYTGRLN